MCTPSGCQDGPHTSRPFLSSAWAPLWHLLSQGKASFPSESTEQNLSTVSKKKGRLPRALHRLGYEMRGHQSWSRCSSAAYQDTLSPLPGHPQSPGWRERKWQRQGNRGNRIAV